MARKDRKKKANEEEMAEAGKALDLRIAEVTRTYSRKLNLSAHGGTQFETLDISESRTAIVSGQDPDEVSDELYRQCKDSVERNIEAYDAQFNTGEKKEKKAKGKKDEEDEDNEELDEISKYINAIINASSTEELKKVKEEISEAAESLKDSQLEYLRKIFSKKATALKK